MSRQKMTVNFVIVVVLLAVVSLQLVSCRSARSKRGTDPCQLPEERGRCRALIPRWRYDHNDGKCKPFNFGGCGGNLNNFLNEHDCLAMCKGESASFCKLHEDKGLCNKGGFTRWRFNNRSKKCQKFHFEGCGGNLNNFETKLDCLAMCT